MNPTKRNKLEQLLKRLTSLDDTTSEFEEFDAELETIAGRFKERVRDKLKRNMETEKLTAEVNKLQQEVHAVIEEIREILFEAVRDANTKVSRVEDSVRSEGTTRERVISELSDGSKQQQNELRRIEREGKRALTEVQKMLLSFEKVAQSGQTENDASFAELRKELERLNVEFVEKLATLSSQNRGGAAHRQLRVDGTEVATRYTDLNLITGDGISITAANDNTARRTNLTITAVGFAAQVPTGAVDGSNLVFVFTTEPNVICVDQGRFMRKTSSDGTANWTGTTTVTLTVAPNFDIFGL